MRILERKSVASKMNGKTVAGAIALAACVGLGAGQAHGATWTGAGDGTSWSDPLNWSGGTLPSATDGAVFNATGAAHLTVNVDSTSAIANGISVSGSKSYTISGNAITLPQKAIISTSGASSSLTLTSDVILQDATVLANRSGYFTAGTGSSLYLNGDISSGVGAGGYDFQLNGGLGHIEVNGSVSTPVRFYSNSAGAGTTAYLNGVNTAPVAMDVTAATYVLNHAGAVTNAYVSTGRGGNATLAVANALTGSSYLSMSSATAQQSSSTTLIQADQDYSGNTSITGTATWVGGPAITASLTVNNGHASLGSATGSGNVAVSGGLLAGDGRIVNADGPGANPKRGVTLSSNAAQGRLSPGATDGAVGTLAFVLGSNGLNIASAVAGTNTQALLFDLDTPNTPGTSDLVTLAGKLTFGSGKLEFDDFKFNLLGGFGAGTYTLFQTNTAITDTLSGTLAGTLDGKLSTLSLDDTGKNIILTVVPEPATLGLLALGGLGLLARRRRA